MSTSSTASNFAFIADILRQSDELWSSFSKVLSGNLEKELLYFIESDSYGREEFEVINSAVRQECRVSNHHCLFIEI